MRSLCSLVLLFTLCANLGFATCKGNDLRDSLTAAERKLLSERTAAIPYPNGTYWIARRGAQEIHVVGTVHIDDPRLDAFTARLTPVVAAADLVLLEATGAEKRALERAVVDEPGLLFLVDGPTLPDVMPEDLWQELADAARARGIPGFMAAKFQPWYLSILLSMPPCLTGALTDGSNGLDQRIMDIAAIHDVETRALEPYDTLFQIFTDVPMGRQIEFLSLGMLPDQVAEDGLATLLNAYFDEETAAIVELSRIAAQRHVDVVPEELDRLFDDLMQRLVDDRNVAWMPRILAAPDGVTIVASGAGHMPGEKGLLSLLAQEGFTLERQ